MIDKQPEALRLADELNALLESDSLVGASTIDKAAAELRRLHEVNAELVEALQEAANGMGGFYLTWAGKAKIALAKAGGEMNNEGYYCVVCGRFLEAEEEGVIVHDDVPHPIDMTKVKGKK